MFPNNVFDSVPLVTSLTKGAGETVVPPAGMAVEVATVVGTGEEEVGMEGATVDPVREALRLAPVTRSALQVSLRGCGGQS